MGWFGDYAEVKNTDMAPLRLGLDLDGVLVDFTQGFLDELARVTGRSVPPGYVQTTWSSWGDYRASEVAAAWERTHTPGWWTRLGTLDHDAMSVPRFLRDLYIWQAEHRVHVTFITSRPAVTARQQSIEWLQTYGFATPQVLVVPAAPYKGQAASLLDLDLMVDDHLANLHAVREHSPRTDAVLFDQPYNQAIGNYFPRVQGLPALRRLIEARLDV